MPWPRAMPRGSSYDTCGRGVPCASPSGPRTDLDRSSLGSTNWWRSPVARSGPSADGYARHVNGSETAPIRTLRATEGAEEALAAALLKALPGTRFVDGPLVPIVILNRDGREHLARCLGALASTAYRNVEIIVVDNGSTYGSPELAESFELPFPVRVIRNEVNRSFSEANGQAVEVVAGELICFLNNDVDPITDDWLGYMVETMTARQAVAVGARLIYPRHRGGVRAGKNHADLSISTRGWASSRRTRPARARDGRGRGFARALGVRGRGEAGTDGGLPARATGRVLRGRGLLVGLQLRHRGCRPVPQAAGGGWPARV